MTGVIARRTDQLESVRLERRQLALRNGSGLMPRELDDVAARHVWTPRRIRLMRRESLSRIQILERLGCAECRRENRS